MPKFTHCSPILYEIAVLRTALLPCAGPLEHLCLVTTVYGITSQRS